jgi:xanthine dehydrogenase molybdopterin-binding subunit B
VAADHGTVKVSWVVAARLLEGCVDACLGPKCRSFDTVKASVDAFNEANRWRKRGVAVMPLKYGISWYGYNAEAIIRIYAADGTVEVSTSTCVSLVFFRDT